MADIVRRTYELGESPRQITKALPHLSVEQVEDALRFYEANKAEIDAYIEHEDQIADEWRERQASTWTKTSSLK